MLYIKKPSTVSENVEKKISKSPISTVVDMRVIGMLQLYQFSYR